MYKSVYAHHRLLYSQVLWCSAAYIHYKHKTVYRIYSNLSDSKKNYFKDCPEIFRIGNYCGHGMSGIIRNWIGNVWFPLSLVTCSENISYDFFSASRSSPVPTTQSSILSFCQKRFRPTFHPCSRSSPQTKRSAENWSIGRPRKRQYVEQEFTVRRNGEVPSNWKSRVHKRLTTRRPRSIPCLLICIGSIVDTRKLQKLPEQ